MKSAEAAAPSLKVTLDGLPVRSRANIEQALEIFGREPRGGLIVAPNFVTFANSSLVVALAERYRLPAIYPFAYYAKEGGLISYGFDAADQFRQGAVYVDKILRGAKPPDLPVQHPTKFETVINFRTAKLLELEVPVQLQQLADEVIQVARKLPRRFRLSWEAPVTRWPKGSSKVSPGRAGTLRD